MNIKEVLLAQFEPDIARQLIAFGQSLAKIDADIVVFLARKSLRLYDILLKLGVPPVEKCVVSDRVLDMSLEPFRGKRVALIDDTLIVGTSLAKIKKMLEQVGATVATHVFCIDETWHCPDLIDPDQATVQLSDDRVMTFCTGEVRAMSLLPVPYLVDFPLTHPFRLKPNEIGALLSNTEWEALKLSTRVQESHGVSAFTLFPSEGLLSEFARCLGPKLYACLDLIKVRIWARRARDSWAVQAVPIITLGPLKEDALAQLNEQLVTLILGSAGELSCLHGSVASARACQRLTQFILSAALGHSFMSGVQERIGRNLRWQFDENETDRHYGPWLHDEMTALARDSHKHLLARVAMISGVSKLRRVAIPKAVRDWTAKSIGVDTTGKPIRTKQKRNQRVSLLADFAEIFGRIYDTREIPARKEARQLGAAYLNAESETPNRDRLEKGVPWQLLVEWMARLTGIPRTRVSVNTFSLLLDLCNDVGIAVPITCTDDGIVYRGYRHGEDVKFADGELALSYDVAEAFLQTAGVNSIPRLVCEKLLVLLIKIGASQRFLEVLYGATGTDGVGRIGFDLKGARPVIRRGPNQRADRDLWLTDYLVSRDVLRAPPKGKGRRGKYLLGTRPQGNYVVSTAPDQAKDLGNIIGMLSRPKDGKPPVLDDGAITILTTCSSPSDTAKALQVELDIFRHWFRGAGNKLVEVDLQNPVSISQTLNSLLKSQAYEAVQAGAFKYSGYKRDQSRLIIEMGAERLKQEPAIIGRRWHSYWLPRQKAKLIAEGREFDPLIDQAATLCWTLAACIAVIEVALRYQQVELDVSHMSQLSAAFGKLRRYRSGMRKTGLSEPRLAKRISERFEEIGSLRQTEFHFEAAEMILQVRAGKQTATPAFAPKRAIEYGFQEVRRLLPDIDSLVDVIDPLFENYGKRADRVDYSHMVYYDIIDSTATYAARQGKDVEQHRAQCLQLKQYLNRWFDRAAADALRHGDDIVCVNGDRTSTNDCKHVFVRGVNASTLVAKIVEGILFAAGSFKMIARIYVLPCNFVGSTVYRQGSDAEMKGTRFWEHWSRLAEQCAELEPEPPAVSSFLLIGTPELIDSLRFSKNVTWMRQQDRLITSEIEFLSRATTVRVGAVNLATATTGPVAA
jgi:hypothetical protein